MTLSMQEFRYEIDCYALDRTKARGPRLSSEIDQDRMKTKIRKFHQRLKTYF